MRAIDRFLQGWRIRKASPFVRAGDRLLDIGCFDGAFIGAVCDRVSAAVGIDPLGDPAVRGKVTILRGTVPGDSRLESASFDCVTMLGTLEHVAEPAAIGRECFRLLKPGGRVVLTVPHSVIHRVVDVMMRLGISDGMGLAVDFGFDVHSTEPLFVQAGFRVLERRRFQLGLNHLYVFEKSNSPAR